MRPTGTDPRAVKRAVMLPIQKGIPLPEDINLPRNAIKNTLKAMAPGDSIVIRRQSLSTCYVRADDLGIVIRAVTMPGGKTCRVWRVE
jgi:hypothetical protein